jgi:hypothetical protein
MIAIEQGIPANQAGRAFTLPVNAGTLNWRHINTHENAMCYHSSKPFIGETLESLYSPIAAFQALAENRA